MNEITTEVSDSIKADRVALCESLKAIVAKRVGSARGVNGWVADALSLSYSAVWRKLNGEAPWSDTDLSVVASRLGLTLKELLQTIGGRQGEFVDAVMNIDGHEKLLRVEKGRQLEVFEQADLVLALKDGIWMVGDARRTLGASQIFEIKAIHNVTAMAKKFRIALLDDDIGVTETAGEMLRLQGVDSDSFSSAEELYQKLGKERYDAYVLDWWLGGQTAEALIKAIRAREDGKDVPIVVVSGEVMTYEADTESELERVSREYLVSAQLKPVRWKLVGADLLQRIGARA